MLNQHAIQLEKVLIARGLTIVKGARDWEISNRDGKRLIYGPSTGSFRMPGKQPKCGRHMLRGSPETVAEILEGMIR